MLEELWKKMEQTIMNMMTQITQWQKFFVRNEEEARILEEAFSLMKVSMLMLLLCFLVGMVVWLFRVLSEIPYIGWNWRVLNDLPLMRPQPTKAMCSS